MINLDYMTAKYFIFCHDQGQGRGEMINLDYMTAKYGQEIVEEGADAKQIEKSVTSALDILYKQGIYALFLWLYAKSENHLIGRKLDEMLRNSDFPMRFATPLFDVSNLSDCLNTVRTDLTGNLKTMIFVSEMINKTLIYSRYRAKAA